MSDEQQRHDQRRDEVGRGAGLIDGRSADLAEQFAGLLWRDLMINLLLDVAGRPNARAIDARAHDAAEAFLRLHSTS